MINFIAGTIFGIIVASIGFGPIASALDGMMLNLQKTTVEINAPKLPPPDSVNK
jgi:hypothetical protein